jgi:NAD(P)-dependent dehydrogenase (short-subunit alcohol dehydrogenase family)
MSNINLSKKIIIITGAFGAIAEYVVKSLLKLNATIILTDIIDENVAAHKMNEIGDGYAECDYYKMDVTKPDEVKRVVDMIFGKYPNLNVVLGHAGGTELQYFQESDAKSFDKIVRFNFLAQTYLARSVLFHWVKRDIAGHIIFTSSYVNRVPHKGIAAYASSKAAIETFSRVLALEYAEYNIRFNMVAPGNVAVGSSNKVYKEDGEYRNMVDRMTPLGQRNTPEAIANIFSFLCSDLAREIDGQVITVDNGVTIPQVG